jgi:uncharacterized protein (TIGR02001 family)
MKMIRTLLIGAVMLIAAPATAGSFANGISVYSDRIRRGISQSDGPGVAAEVKYNANSGWFGGLWAGTVRYDNVTGESLEILPFIGYRHKIGSFTAEVGLLHHGYPGADRPIGYDEAEVTLSHKLGKGSLSAGTYFRLRNESGGHSWYWFSDGRFPLGSSEGAKVALGLHAGFYRDPGDSRNDYSDASVEVFATKGRAIIGLGASDSSLSRSSPMPGAPDAGRKLFISFTRMFRRSH